jgi:hypothetical protein
MTARARHIDKASIAVIATTLVLFAASVVEKGLSHDLLLEAGVFLVSIKLILLGAKAQLDASEIRSRLDAIRSALDRLEPAGPP